MILRFPYTSYDALICDGAVRAGKTIFMTLSFILWGMATFDGCAFAICGKSIGAVERNIIQPLMGVRYIREQFRMLYNRGSHVLHVSRAGKSNDFFVFGGKDESSYALIQGITLAGVMLDEVALMPRSFVEQALARCSVKGSKYFFNCNPDHPLHWFYQEWIKKADEKKAQHIHFLMTDNPGLDPEVLERYERQYVGVFYKRYVLGLWVAADGMVYDMYDIDNDPVTDDDVPIGMVNRGSTRRYIAVDFGMQNATAALDIYDDGQTVWILNEYYYSGRDRMQGQKTVSQYADDLLEFGALDALAVIIDPSAAPLKAELRLRGVRVKDAVNDVLPGIQHTAALLGNRTLKIHRRCQNLIGEIGGYIWDEKALDRGEEKPVKVNDHAVDALRYFCYTMIPERRLMEP
jgi:PBSX family phage terminase large subunit